MAGKGRPKGSQNKATGAFREALEAIDFSIPAKIVELYEDEGTSPLIKSKLLELMTGYAYPKPKPLDDGNGDSQLSELLNVMKNIPTEVLLKALKAPNGSTTE